MKTLTADEALVVFADEGGRLRYSQEVLDFIKSTAQVAELSVPHGVSASSAASAFRMFANKRGFKLHFITRGDSVIAYKDDAYKIIRQECYAGRYADRIISEIAEKEAREEFFKEWDY